MPGESQGRGMKKLLMVTDAWAPQVNGVTRVIEAHMRVLKERGYDVRLVEPSQFVTVPFVFYPEIPLALFPRRRVEAVIEEWQPDAIHIATEGPLGSAARSVCRKKKILFTTWYHTRFELYFDLRLRGLLRPIALFVRRFHSAATRVMVSTESLKRELEAAGYKNVVVVPLGVDTAHFSRNPTPPVPVLPKPVFMFFSRLAPEKSPEEFLKLELPGSKVVVGDGPERTALEKKYGATNTFVGYKHGQELVDWLSSADVLVFPSRTETFGLVVVEALACGVPVAAHDAMGPRDIITHGKDGYLSEDLHAAAIQCLNYSRDDCRTKALQYDWERSGTRFIEQLAWIER